MHMKSKTLGIAQTSQQGSNFDLIKGGILSTRIIPLITDVTRTLDESAKKAVNQRRDRLLQNNLQALQNLRPSAQN